MHVVIYLMISDHIWGVSEHTLDDGWVLNSPPSVASHAKGDRSTVDFDSEFHTDSPFTQLIFSFREIVYIYRLFTHTRNP